MAENYTPNPVTTFVNDTTAANTVNNNFTAISTAFTDVLSRSGVSPNQMTSTLDMNNNQIINLPFPSTANSPARLIDVVSPGSLTVTNATTGTSGHAVPFLDGANTWSAVQNFNAGVVATNTNRNYVGASFVSQAVSSDGGGVGSEKGTIFGINPIAILNAAATNMAGAAGGEVNTSLVAGSTVLDKYGWAIVQLNSDAVSGSRSDAGLFLANQAGSVGWKNGIQFGDTTNQFPVKTAGTLIKTVGGATVVSGIDFTATTFSTGSFLANGFSVGATGLIISGGAGIASGIVQLSGTTSGNIQLQTSATSNLLTVTQPVQVGVIGATAGTLSLAGLTSGSSTLSCSSTGGTLQLGAGNLTIDASGNLITAGKSKVGSTTAPVAGGDSTNAYLYGSGSNFGIYFGAGAPTITAAQGSIYLNTTGSSTSTRLYVNTTGSTTWTNFTSAA